MSSGRAVAVRVLVRVTEQGAFASRALDAELGRTQLDAREAALATEIVYGALRVLPELDARVAALLHEEFARLDPVLRAALRAGCYQLWHLARVPPHAVVDESVRIVHAERGPKLAGVANAVLRKLATARPAEARGASRVLMPDWLAPRLERALGTERLERLQGAGAAPPLSLRVATGRDREQVASEIRAARPDAQVQAGVLSARCLLLRRAGDPRALPGFAQGSFSVQEEGAQLVVASLGARAGEHVADLCAGHGGKTIPLCEAVGEHGKVLAADLDPRKLERLGPELARHGIASERVECRAIDLTVGVAGLEAGFDRVLVDAPCSGLGTLRRRPELLLRLREGDFERLAELQHCILRNALRLVRPGGLLVYAVCSPALEEGARVADRLQQGLPSIARVWEPSRDWPSALVPDSDGIVRFGPWSTDQAGISPDAFQIVSFRLPG